MTKNITAYDLMDSGEVCEAFGIARSTLSVAMSRPHVVPTISDILPPPLRKIGPTWVWLRTDIEAALKERK